MNRWIRMMSGAAAAALLVGCTKNAPTAAAPPPAEVSVLTVGTENMTLTTELPGRIRPVREAQVRARATGILLKRHFDEGANVKEGDLLFQIDPAPLKAALNRVKAEYAQTEAALKESRATVERYRGLVEISAVSKKLFDEALATLAQDEAELLVRKAAVETAELNLSYSKVIAPISGRIGKALVTEGALASATEATELAVIRQLDPVYFDITESSTDVLRMRRAMEGGAIQSIAPGEARITLVLDDGTQYAHPGRLLFSDVAVNPATGMITLRAEVPNPENILLPGMFGRGVLVQGRMTNAVTIPQRTVARGGAAGNSTVLVVDPENKVEARNIKIDREIGSKVIVESGLKAGEIVIVEGSQKAPPGSVVKPVPFGAESVASTRKEKTNQQIN